MKHQILIASYKKDFEWLEIALTSIRKFGSGWYDEGWPVIAVPAADFDGAATRFIGLANITMFDGSHGRSTGFARAQEAMMSGDILCPGADFVWLWGSDCIATGPFSPADFCDSDGQPIMQHVSWDNAGPARFWRDGTTSALGWQPAWETMRRLPIGYPAELFPQARSCVEKFTSTPFSEYLMRAVNGDKNFSESNTLGEIAWKFFRHRYRWQRIDLPDSPPYAQTPVLQFWSHGGLDRPMEEHGYVLPDGSNVTGRTPREILTSLGLLGT